MTATTSPDRAGGIARAGGQGPGCDADRPSMLRSLIVAAVGVFAVGSCNADARSTPTGVDATTEAEPASQAGSSDDAKRTHADAHVGVFRHSGGAKERDAVEAAIEAVVSEMNVIARGIARDRLRAANQVPDRITIERNGDTIAIAFDDRRYEAALDGSISNVKGITGDPLEYRVSVSKQRVRQSFKGEKGGRKNDLHRVGDDGLRVDVEVSSSSLPAPLRYTLTFKRE